MHLRSSGALLTLLLVSALAACGGGGGGGGSSAVVPTSPPTSASATIPIPPIAMGGPGPSFGGYSPTFWYPANDASPSPEPSALLTTSTTAIANLPSPAPPGTPLANFSLKLQTTLTFQGCPYFSPVTVPSSVVIAGHTFYESAYDLTTKAAIACDSTGFTASGQSISFSGFPTAPITLNASDTYVVVLSYQ
ncbi:hypothetical protein EPN42_08165 [bacterium]|nr:MAG: hypothetical protein EPN42_08165 [bacterium]